MITHVSTAFFVTHIFHGFSPRTPRKKFHDKCLSFTASPRYVLMFSDAMSLIPCRVIALLLFHKAKTGNYIPYWTQRITKVVFLIYGENRPVTISFKLSLLEYNRSICDSVPLTLLTYVFYVDVLWVIPLSKQADMVSSSCLICVKHIWKSKSIRVVAMQM